MAVDISKEIRRTVDTGKVEFGSKSTLKNALNGKCKLIIVSENTEKESADEIKRVAKLSEIPTYDYKGSSLDLGSICGKPFPVSMISIMDAGKSKLLEAASGKEVVDESTKKKTVRRRKKK